MPPKASIASRYPDRIGFGFLIWMVICALVVSAGGITYAALKNEQVAISTDINKLHREIAVCNMNANQYRAAANDQTRLLPMRDRLAQDGSSLRDIERSQIEVARRADASRMTAIAR